MVSVQRESTWESPFWSPGTGLVGNSFQEGLGASVALHEQWVLLREGPCLQGTEGYLRNGFLILSVGSHLMGNPHRHNVMAKAHVT